MINFPFANYKRHDGREKPEVTYSNSDFAASTVTNGIATAEASVTGEIEVPQGNELFEINLAPGQVYELELVPSVGGNALLDPLFDGIFNSNGELIRNTSSEDVDSSASVQVRSTSIGDITAFPGSSLQIFSDVGGTFFLSIVGFGSTTGQYRLVATELGVVTNDRFDITLEFNSSDAPDVFVRAFENAAERWEEVITGDLPYAFVDGYGFVDDILIEVATEEAELLFEGVDQTILAISSILGQRQEDIQVGSSLPTHAQIVVNASAAIAIEQNLDELAANTIGRALGFGALWEELGLVGEFEGVLNYIGTNALREAAELSSTLDGASILEDGASGGLAGQYWNEAVLNSELMTSSIEFRGIGSSPRPSTAPDNPLSNLTIGAMEDLGYGVNYQAADPFAIV